MIRKLFCRITGYRYHYRVRLEYRSKSAKTLASINMTMGTTSPRLANDHREVKKVLAPKLIKAVPRSVLCNGVVVFEPLAFIGLFRPDKGDQP